MGGVPRNEAPLGPLEAAMLLVLLPWSAAALLALGSAGLGRLSPGLAAAGGLLTFLGTAAWAWRRLRAERMERRPEDIPAAPDKHAWVLELATLGLVLFLVVRSAPANTPWPGFLDASWYANAGARIAREGSLAFRPAALDLPAGARSAFVTPLAAHRAAGLPIPPGITGGFHAQVFTVPEASADPTLVYPWHPPLFSASLALWARAFGIGAVGGGVLPWILAYLLALAMLARAAFGPACALLAVTLFGLGPAFAYYGGHPYAEPAAGALALAGVWALARLAPEPRARPGWAGAAGLALGLACLAKVDLLPAALAALLGWLLTRRRAGGVAEGFALLLGLILGLAPFLALAPAVSRVYLAVNGGGVLARWTPGAGPALGGLGLLLVGLVGAAFVASRRRRAAGGQGSRRAGRSSGHSADGAPGGLPALRPRRLIALILVVLLGIGSLAAWRVPEDQAPAMLAILAWLVTPLGLWAAVAGLVWALDEASPRAEPLLAQALVVLPLLMIDPVVTRSLSSLYSARRLLPLALPLVTIFAAMTAVRLLGPSAEGPRWRTARFWLAAAGTLLVAFNLAGAAAPFRGAAGRDFGGGPAMARRLAAYGGEADVWVFASTLAGDSSGRMAAALWNLEERSSAVLASPEPDPSALAEAVAAWRGAGRRVFYVDNGRGQSPEWPGLRLEELGREAIVTSSLAPAPALPPRMAPLPLDFRVQELVPAAP